MFASIRRHQNWIWYVVVVVIIISFVGFFSPSGRFGSGPSASGRDFGTMNGRPISLEEYARAQKEAKLYYFFQTGGQWPGESSKTSGYDLQAATYSRLVLLEKMREQNVDPGDKAAAAWVKQIMHPKDEEFSLDTYNQIINTAYQQQGITPEDFQKFARHEVGREQMMALHGLAGTLVPPQEVEVIYRREFTPLLCDAVYFPISNYLASVSAPQSALTAYYSNNIPDYSLPVRVQVDYVRFAATNYLAEVDSQKDSARAIAAKADEVYAKEGASHYTDSSGNPLPVEAAKAKIREEVRYRTALQIFARRAANTFLTAVLDKGASDTNALETVAKQQGLQVRISSLFDEKNGPVELGSPDIFRRASFSLSPENRMLSSAIPTDDGYYIVVFRRRLPSEAQSFTTVRDRVLEDFKTTSAFKMAYAAGESFLAAATNALAKGQAFTQICAAQKVTPSPLPPFSPSTRSLPEVEDRMSFREVQRTAFELAPGQLSGFLRTRDGGMVVYLRAKAQLDEAKMKAEIPAFTDQVRRRREYMAFNEWIGQETQRLQVKAPKSK